MTILPVLFTLGKQFGNSVIFGLLDKEGLHPVRQFPLNKVRDLFGEQSKPVSPDLDLLLIGNDCMTFLADIDLLSPILESMAAELAGAFAKAKTPRKGSKAEAALGEELKAIGRTPVTDQWGRAMTEPSDAEVERFIEQHPSGATYDEIAEVLGVTRQRVPQILASAISKVMKELRWYGIRSTYDICPPVRGGHKTHG